VIIPWILAVLSSGTGVNLLDKLSDITDQLEVTIEYSNNKDEAIKIYAKLWEDSK